MADSEIRISADTSGVQAGAQEVKASLKQMGDAAQAQSRRGAEGMKQMGNAAEAAAKKAEAAARQQQRASDSYTRHLQREIALAQAGKRGSAEYHEAVMKQRGIEISAQQRLLLETLKTNQAQKESLGLHKQMVGNISIGQYNNAMRMLPAQMTDVVTQLAGGQNPLLIALQQGGQTRDIFGGFGNMFKGISSLITPTRLAIGGLAGGVAALAYAMYQGAEESRAYQKALILAGDGAGISAGKLQDVALAVGETTGGYASAREAVLAFVASGKIGAENYQQFAHSVVLQSQATGQSIDELVQKYTEIANDPLKAVVSLSVVYRNMTADVYAQAKALIEQGRQQEAVALVQRKYADESENMASRVLENLGVIERAWLGVKEGAAGAWDVLKSIGRKSTLADELLAVNIQISQLENSKIKAPFIFGDKAEQQLQDLKRQRQILQVQQAEEERKAKLSAQQAQDRIAATSAAQYFDGLEDKLATRQEQRRKLEIEAEKQLQALRKGGAAAQIADAETALAKLKQQHREEAKAEAERAAKAGKRAAADKTLYPTTSAGLRLKPGAEAAGQAYGGTYAMAHAMQQMLGTNLQRFGAFRGQYHIGKNSLHNKGLAFDATPNASMSAKEKAAVPAQIRKYLASLGFEDGKDFKIQFEMGGQRNKNGTVSTADHWHFNWQNQAAAARFAGGVGGQAKAMSNLGLFKAPEQTPYEKWQENHSRAITKTQIEAQLAADNLNKSYAHQLSLLTNPEYANFTDTQKQTALEAAKQADAQAHLNSVAKKYGDITENLQAQSRQQLDDKLFEISLIGKTREEIEKLTLARLWDQKIAEAQKAGAPPEMIAQMETGKTGSLADLGKKQQVQKEVDADWQGGFKKGMQEYVDSFGSMNDAIAGATEQTFNKMGDAIADFVATGKLDFRGLTVSILQDLSKMLVKMAIVNAMKAALGGYADGGVVGGGKYSGGGYTGHGGKHEPAGVVHKGEVVFSQRDVANHGGVAAVERLRLRGYADGGAVGLPVRPVPGGRVAAGGGNTTINITIHDGGRAESDSQADTEMGKALAQALPGMIEQWYVKNVARPGAVYNKG